MTVTSDKARAHDVQVEDAGTPYCRGFRDEYAFYRFTPRVKPPGALGTAHWPCALLRTHVSAAPLRVQA